MSDDIQAALKTADKILCSINLDKILGSIDPNYQTLFQEAIQKALYKFYQVSAKELEKNNLSEEERNKMIQDKISNVVNHHLSKNIVHIVLNEHPDCLVLEDDEDSHMPRMPHPIKLAENIASYFSKATHHYLAKLTPEKDQVFSKTEFQFKTRLLYQAGVPATISEQAIRLAKNKLAEKMLRKKKV